MENSLEPRRSPVCRFGPDPRLTAATGCLTALAAGAALLTADAAGRVLFALAAGVLLLYTVTDLGYRPRIVASADGLVLRQPSGSAELRWEDVTAVRVDTTRRHRLRSVTLEIDAAERLHVFSRRALGADPEQVAGLINAMDPR